MQYRVGLHFRASASEDHLVLFYLQWPEGQPRPLTGENIGLPEPGVKDLERLNLRVKGVVHVLPEKVGDPGLTHLTTNLAQGLEELLGLTDPHEIAQRVADCPGVSRVVLADGAGRTSDVFKPRRR